MAKYRILVYEQDSSFAELLKADYRKLVPSTQIEVTDNASNVISALRGGAIDVLVLDAAVPEFHDIVQAVNPHRGKTSLMITMHGRALPDVTAVKVWVGFLENYPYTAKDLNDAIGMMIMTNDAAESGQSLNPEDVASLRQVLELAGLSEAELKILGGGRKGRAESEPIGPRRAPQSQSRPRKRN